MNQFNCIYCDGRALKPSVEIFFPYKPGESYAARITRMMRWLAARQATCAWRVIVSPLASSLAVFEPDWKEAAR